MGQEGAAVFAQVEGIEVPLFVGKPFRHVCLKKIIDITMQVEHRPVRRCGAVGSQERSDHFPLVIVRHWQYRLRQVHVKYMPI